MQTVAHNPVDGIYPASADYIHALEVRGAARLLFVAGTMGLAPDGVAGTSLEEQLRLIWSNIGAETLVSDWLVEIEVIAAG